MRAETWAQRWAGPIVAALLVVVGGAAVFRMEHSVADYDPQYMRTLVERTMRFGGSYYENGIHNKGPLEPIVYEWAARLGGSAGFWLWIAVFTLAAAMAVGLAAATVARRFGAGPVVAASAGVAVVVHLTLSQSDYAGVLYARNLVVAMMSSAFVITLADRAWSTPRRRMASVLAVGLLVGLAVQTLVTAALTAGPLLVWAMWHRRAATVGRWPAWGALVAVSAAAFFSAPLYYRVFGPWADFRDGWWTYARFMNVATERSLVSQFTLGVDQFTSYVVDRPLVTLSVIAFVAVSALRWRRCDPAERGMRVVLFVWWLCGWIELVLSQRYSSHYFSVVAVPTMLMMASLVGDVCRRYRLGRFEPRLVGLPLAAVLLALAPDGTEPLVVGAAAASRFTSTDRLAEEHDRYRDGRVQMVRASLDLVSTAGDPLLVWTSRPWHYLDLERVSATRYIWKSFLLGEIYLAGSGPQYVLPGTWDNFAADLDRAHPTAFVVHADEPVEPATPFAERVERDFTTVFADDTVTLAYRNDLADWLLAPPRADRTSPGSDAATSDGAASQRSATPGRADVLVDPAGCVRLDGELSLGGDDVEQIMDVEQITFRFGHDVVAPSITVNPRVDGGMRVTSLPVDRAPFAIDIAAGLDGAVNGEPGGPADSAVDGDLDGTVDQRVGFTLVVAGRSAVLVIDDRIVAAVRIDGEGPVAVGTLGGAVESVLDTDSIVRSAPPDGSGC